MNIIDIKNRGKASSKEIRPYSEWIREVIKIFKKNPREWSTTFLRSSQKITTEVSSSVEASLWKTSANVEHIWARLLQNWNLTEEVDKLVRLAYSLDKKGLEKSPDFNKFISMYFELDNIERKKLDTILRLNFINIYKKIREAYLKKLIKIYVIDAFEKKVMFLWLVFEPLAELKLLVWEVDFRSIIDSLDTPEQKEFFEEFLELYRNS